MFAAIRKAAPLAAIAAAAILAGCAVEPAPYYDNVYAYAGPSTVFVDPDYHHRYYDYRDGTYGHEGHFYGGGNHWDGGAHGGAMHGGGHG